MSVLGRRGMRRAVFALALLCAAALNHGPAQADMMTVAVDQASVLKLPGQVATIVIGNPMIADASLQRGGLLVVTGKGYGATNIVALDRSGNVVMQKTVQVLGAGGDDIVTVYRGVERESYSCAPDCEKRITLGDSPAYFNGVLAQSGARNSAAGPNK